MPTTHLLDPDRGRASKTKMWTLCGEQAMTRLVFGKLDAPQATCKACILAEALIEALPFAMESKCQHTSDLAGNETEKADMITMCRAALARARGEQIPDAPK